MGIVKKQTTTNTHTKTGDFEKKKEEKIQKINKDEHIKCGRKTPFPKTNLLLFTNCVK